MNSSTPSRRPIARTALESLVDGVHDLVYCVTREGEPILANPSFLRSLGLASDEDFDFFDRIHQDDTADWVDRIDDTLTNGGSPEAFRYRICDEHGDWRWHETRGSSVRLAEFEEPVFLGIGVDVSNEIVADVHRIRHEKLQGIGALAGGIAHDIGNLLTPMIGFSQLLRDHPDNKELVIEFVNVVDTNVSKLDTLTRDLMLFGRKSSGDDRPMDLHSTVTEVLAESTPEIPGDIDLDVTLADQVLLLRGEPAPVGSMLAQVIRNAVDAMPNGGRLEVETAVVEPDERLCESCPGIRSQPYAQVRITDTGIGMDPETRDKMFEPFFSTKKTGQDTGLGLTLALKIAEDHQGFIQVQTRAEEGTTVSILLPLITSSELRPSAFSPETIGQNGTE